MPNIKFTSESGSIECNMGEWNNPYVIVAIDGMTPADANINTSNMAHKHGVRFDSAKVMMRTINVAIAITRRAEENRQYLYRVFRPSKKVRVDYKSELLDVWIEGYVSQAPVGLMDNKQIMTVQIECPYPFFKGREEIINRMNTVVNAFHFPFAITAEAPIPISYQQGLTNIVVTNNGAVDVMANIELEAVGDVGSPKIFNYVTGEFFGLDYNLTLGDKVSIGDAEGNKTVTLVRDGEEVNIFNYIQKGSTWLELNVGDNVFTYEVGHGDTDDLTVLFKHYDAYTGV